MDNETARMINQGKQEVLHDSSYPLFSPELQNMKKMSPQERKELEASLLADASSVPVAANGGRDEAIEYATSQLISQGVDENEARSIAEAQVRKAESENLNRQRELVAELRSRHQANNGATKNSNPNSKIDGNGHLRNLTDGEKAIMKVVDEVGYKLDSYSDPTAGYDMEDDNAPNMAALPELPDGLVKDNSDEIASRQTPNINNDIEGYEFE